MAQPQRKLRDDRIEFAAGFGPHCAESATESSYRLYQATPAPEFDTVLAPISTRPFVLLGLGFVSFLALGVATGHLLVAVAALGCTVVLVGFLVAVSISVLNNTPAGW